MIRHLQISLWEIIRQLLSQCLFWERTHFPSISHYSQSILRILPSDILAMIHLGDITASDVQETGHQQVWYWLCVLGTEKKWYVELTHWGRVTHICISKWTIISSNNGLSPSWPQAINWTSAILLTIGTNFSEILIESHIHFHSRKCIWKCHLQHGICFVPALMC